MTTLLLLAGVLLVGAGVVGLVLPAVPGIALVFLGAVAIAAADEFTRVGPWTLALLALLAVAASVLDYLAGVLGAKKFGASRWGVAGAMLGLVLGLPLGLPGLVFGPAVGAVALELLRDPDARRAGRAGFGTLVGLLVGTAIKYAFAGVIIGILIVSYF
ncbi:MAG: DUF456 family protein [Acidobacteria bacterium]|nr:DUF456 family protein [Acidobacteriota bacterium]